MNTEKIISSIEAIEKSILQLKVSIAIQSVEEKKELKTYKKLPESKRDALLSGQLFTYTYSTEVYRYEVETGLIVMGNPKYKLSIVGFLSYSDERGFNIKYSIFGLEYSAEFFFSNVEFKN